MGDQATKQVRRREKRATRKARLTTAQIRAKRIQARAFSAKTELLEYVGDGIVALDGRMNCAYVNAKGAELLGRKPRDLIGKNYWREFSEAKETPFASACRQVLEAQKPTVLVAYYAPRDRWLENRIYPSRDGLLIVLADVTERKRAEEEAKKSEDKFRDVFESANVGKSITSPDGRISVNKAFADMLGYNREELAHKTWQELTPPEEVEPIEAMLAPLLNGEKDSARFIKRYIHKDESNAKSRFLAADCLGVGEVRV